MKKLSTLILLGFLLLGCGRFGKKDSHGDKDRIVSVSKQMTEFLFALNLGNKIVGIDLTSTYPAETKKLTTVGYHRHLMVAHDYGADSIAKRLNEDLDRQLQKAESIVKMYPTRPRVLIIHFGQQRNQYFVMGTKGTANAMLSLAGGDNAADTSSFRDLSAEVIAREQPDVILATDFGFDRLGGSMQKFMELPGIALTPAAKNGKIYRIEEHDLVYFGPRTGENIIKIAKLIHQ